MGPSLYHSNSEHAQPQKRDQPPRKLSLTNMDHEPALPVLKPLPKIWLPSVHVCACAREGIKIPLIATIIDAEIHRTQACPGCFDFVLGGGPRETGLCA